MSDFREFMRQQTLEATRLRILPAVPDDDRLAMRLATDLWLTVQVGSFRDSHLASENAWLDRMGEQEILEIATMNTSVELLAAEPKARDHGACWTLTSSSYSTAVMLTMLDDAVPVPEGRRLDLERGVLVSAPTPRTLGFAALDGPGSFIRGVEALIRHALGCATGREHLSSSVYLVDHEGIGRVAYPSWIEGTPVNRLAAPDWLRVAVERGEL